MTSSTGPFYVEMIILRTRKVYIVDANMAHMQKSGGGDYKLTVDQSSPRIEVPFKRICEIVSYLSTSVMTPDMLADIKNHKKMDVRVMVRSMGSRDTGIVFTDAIVNPDKCTADKVAVELAIDKKVSLHAPADVIVRDGGPISKSDPIYLRWVREYDEKNKKRRASETLPEKEVGSAEARDCQSMYARGCMPEHVC